MSDPIVSPDESAIENELKKLVIKTVEGTINALPEEEADALVGAERYERTAGREAYRAGRYNRNLTTTSSVVNVETPKLKGIRFATAVIERHRRREVSVEEADVETCLAGVSTGRIEDVGKILRGASVSAGTVSNLNEKAFGRIEERRCRPLEKEYRYVYVDGIYLKRGRGGSFENVAVTAAVGVDEDGYREIIGCHEGHTESKECRAEFPSRLRSGGLRGVRMFTGDKDAGMTGALAEVFPDARYRRCTVHFYPNVLSKAPKSKRAEVAAMLKAIHAWESRRASEEKAAAVVGRLKEMKLLGAAKVVDNGILETLAYTDFPMRHRRRIRTDDAIERLNREIRRRTRVVGTFPDGKSALMPAAARLEYVAGSEWGSMRYLDVSLLDEWPYR